MKITLFHTKSENAILKNLVKEVKEIVSNKDFQLCHKFVDFVELVKTIQFKFGVTIIVVSNNIELENLFSIKNFLNDLNLIIVLPDYDQDKVKKARLFYPRFIGYLDSSYCQITPIIEKIFEKELQKSSKIYLKQKDL